MTRIDRYLAGWFLRVFSLAAGAFLALFVIVMVFERMGMFLKYDAKFEDAALLIATKVPWMLTQVIPMAALLGALVTLTILSRNGETTALRTAGVSLSRIARPFALCGFALLLFTFFLQEAVVPPASTFSQEVRYLRIRGVQSLDLVDSGDAWLRYGTLMVHVNQALPEKKLLLGIEAFDLGEGRIRRRLRADRAEWDGGTWVLRDVRDVSYPLDEGWRESAAERLPLMIAPKPDDLVTTERRPEEMSLRDLDSRIRSARAQGLSVGKLEVDWWSKTSLPFACLVMPLLSIPFALRPSRRGGLWAGVAVGVGVGFCYFLVLLFSITLGRAGLFPPWLAAWAPNVLFLAVAAHLIRRAERGL